MWPLCSLPSRLLLPRSSKSAAATEKPEPSSVYRWRVEILVHGFFGDLLRDQEGTIALLLASAHPSSQLIELRKSHQMCIVNDDGVHILGGRPPFSTIDVQTRT